MNPPNVVAENAARHHTRIQPTSGWFYFNMHELWRYRDLFLILMLRDVKVRYKQTLLGMIWVILQPLAAAGIFAIIFGNFAELPTAGIPYGLYVFVAMLPWNMFSGALQRAGTSLVSDSRLISKVYFPRVVIPIASSGAVLIDFCVAFVVGVFLMASYGYYPSLRWVMVLVFLALLMILTVGIALFISALNVYYRDFMYALPFIIQVWLYASPIAYSTDIVPVSAQRFYALNPMVGVIAGFRWALLSTGTFPWEPVGFSVVISLIFFALGYFVFQQIEDNFADVI